MTEPFKLKTGPLAGMEVISAPQDRVGRLDRWVQIVLDALGHPDAYVTDQSSVGDFFSYDADNEDRRTAQEAQLKAVGERLGLTLSYDDLIADVAERLQGGQ